MEGLPDEVLVGADQAEVPLPAGPVRDGFGYGVAIARPVIEPDPTGKAPGGVITGGELAAISLVPLPPGLECYRLTVIREHD